VRFRHQRSCGRSSEAEGQISPLANISPLVKLQQKDFAINELEESQVDKGHVEQTHWCRDIFSAFR